MRGSQPLPGVIPGIPFALARRWVMTSSLVATLGYAAMAITTIANQRAGGNHVLANMIPAALLCLVALLAARAGKVLAAGMLIIVTVWVQTQLSYALTSSVPMPGMMVTPVVVVGTALLVGVRWSFVMAVASVVLAWPFTLWSPPLRESGLTPNAIYWLTLHGIVVMVAWALVSIALTTLTRMFVSMREQQDNLRETLRVAPDGIVVVRADQTVAVVNPAAALIFDLPAAACEGCALQSIFARAGFASDVPVDVLESAPQESRVMWSTHRRDGTELHLELAWSRMAGGRRQLLLHDATERVRTETARRTMELQLAHGQRLESIGLLAAGIAHDFNNILTVVGGCGEMLQRGGAGAPVSELVREILGAHARGTALTQQLLSFARRDQAQPVVVDLGARLQELERFLQRVAGEQVRVVLQPAADCRIRIDVNQLEQALVNLVSNARDAMPAGGECLIAVDRVAEPTLGAVVRVRVVDHGIGMDANTVARAFDPFFTTKTRGRGTGLGLAVLHGTVTKAGGTVSLDSEPGRGTTVTMQFPAVSSEAPAATPSVVDATLGGTVQETILIVEDDDGTRAVAGRMLRELGYSVLLASGGDEALRLESEHPGSLALLLSDVMMPGMLGPDLAARMRERRPDVPVLFMSGYPGDALSRVPGLRLETDFIAKPFRYDDMARMVRQKIVQPTRVPRA